MIANYIPTPASVPCQICQFGPCQGGTGCYGNQPVNGCSVSVSFQEETKKAAPPLNRKQRRFQQHHAPKIERRRLRV